MDWKVSSYCSSDATHKIVPVVTIIRHDPLGVNFALDDPNRVIALAAFFGEVSGFEEDRDGTLVGSGMTARSA